MITALIYFSASAGILLLLSILYTVEDKKGHRVVVLRGFREWLDRLFSTIVYGALSIVSWLWKGLIQFVLRHGVSRLLGLSVS